MLRKCEACGEKDECITCSSSFSGQTFALCRSCYANDIYPYDSLVSNVWSIDGINNATDWFKTIVENNLTFYGKTKEELDSDVNFLEYKFNEENKLTEEDI